MLKSLEVDSGYMESPTATFFAVNFRTTKKPRVQRPSAKASQCAAFRTFNVSVTCHQKAMLGFHQKVVNQNTIEVDCKVQQWVRYTHHTSLLMLHDAPVAWVHGHCQLFW